MTIDPKTRTRGPAIEASEPQESLVGRLYREHNQALIRFLMARVDSEAEARDVAQEAYVRLLHLDTPGAVSFLSAYLFKTAANIAVDRGRQRQLQRRIHRNIAELAVDSWAPEPARSLAARQELDAIETFLQELPLKCRQAFYLHRLYDLSPPDIAARLGIKKRMVHKHLVRAMVHLRERLADGETGLSIDKTLGNDQ